MRSKACAPPVRPGGRSPSQSARSPHQVSSRYDARMRRGAGHYSSGCILCIPPVKVRFRAAPKCVLPWEVSGLRCMCTQVLPTSALRVCPPRLQISSQAAPPASRRVLLFSAAAAMFSTPSTAQVARAEEPEDEASTGEDPSRTLCSDRLAQCRNACSGNIKTFQCSPYVCECNP